MTRRFCFHVIIEDINGKATFYPHFSRFDTYSEAVTFSLLFACIPNLKIMVITVVYT